MASKFGQWGGGGVSDSPVVTGTVTTPPTSTAAPSTLSSPSSGANLSYGGYGGGGDDGFGGDTSVSGPSNPSAGTGAGGPGGVASNGMGMYFDDGGMVPVDDESNDTSTVDPMAMVQSALQFGRKQMGLPASFYGDQPQDQSQPGMFDGGVVPDDNEQQSDPSVGTGAPMADPRSALQYLTGSGGVSPDVAAAMEGRADPAGQMSPAGRVLAAIQSAGDPGQAFGLMQHYRSKYNALSGAARAALDQGNLAAAAAHATKAMANVPSGHDVQFAPARGGVAVMAKKLGQQAPQQQRSFGQGGTVDTDNPMVAMEQSYDGGGTVPPTDQPTERMGDAWKFDKNGNWVKREKPLPPGTTPAPGYDDGGPVEDPDDPNGWPLSTNVEDRRPEGDPTNGDNMDTFEGAMYNGKRQGQQPIYTKSGRVNEIWNKVGAKAFDDGGVVDTGDDDATQDAGDQESQSADQGDVSAPAPDQGTLAPDEAPQVLNPDQFKQVMTAGYDAPVEKGWGQFISDILNKVNPFGGGDQAQATEPQGAQPSTGAPPQGNGSTTPSQPLWQEFARKYGMMSAPSEDTGQMSPDTQGGTMLDKLKGTWHEGAPDVSAALQSDQPAAPQQRQQQGPPAPPGGQSVVKKDQSQLGAGSGGPPPGSISQEDFTATLKKYRDGLAAADPNFNWASRNKELTDKALALTIQELQERGKLANNKLIWSNKAGMENAKLTQSDTNNQRTNGVRSNNAQLLYGQRAQTAQENVLAGIIKTQINNNPGANLSDMFDGVLAQAQKLGIKPGRTQQLYLQQVQPQDQGQQGQQSQGDQSEQQLDTSKMNPAQIKYIDVHGNDIDAKTGLTKKQLLIQRQNAGQ